MTSIFKSLKMGRRLALAVGALALLSACDTTAGFGGGGVSRAVDPGDTVKVALLVPLGSGKADLTTLGTSLVNAARLAQADLSGAKVDLRVYETAGDPARAAAVAQTAIDGGAQIILGPLFSTATASVSQVAAPRGVNVLSFSNNSAVAGQNTYLLGLTFESIANRLVGYAAGKGLRNVGVVHTADVAGQSGVAAVRSAASRSGANFVGSAAYPLSAEGISNAAPQVAQTIRSTGANAVVFTDSPSGGLTFLTSILNTMGVRNSSQQFIGLTRWNAGGSALNEATLNGGWFAAPDSARAAQFNSRYRGSYGSGPHPLAGLAYDGVAAIGAMIKKAKSSGSRNAFAASAITTSSGFAGVNGAFRFTSSGQNERALAILEVAGGGTRVVSPAPSGFGSAGF